MADSRELPWLHPEMHSVREDWLAMTPEAALEPGLPIIDAHHHLWHRSRRYMLDEMLEDIAGGHNVKATVFVQVGAMYRADGPEERRPLGETEFVNGIAAMAASGRYGTVKVAAAIVAFVDLRAGDLVEPLISEHLAVSGGRVRGIRNLFQWDEDPSIFRGPLGLPNMLAETRFREGFAKLETFGLPYDAWLFFHQIPELADLADAFPRTTIVADHMGGVLGIGRHVGKRQEVFQIWRKSLRDLARRPNVKVKLGGMGMPSSGFAYTDWARPPSSEQLAADWRPYIETCIEAFGPDRCMFESNFPVDKLSCSYAVLWNAFKRLTAGASAAEKAALYHDTAARTYRL